MTLEEIHSEWSEMIGQNVCIAGGAVRDTLMGRKPKDYDIFIKEEPSEGCFDGVSRVVEMDWHNYEPFLRGTFEWRGVTVQVMCTGHESTESLVDGFDWNVCLFAFDGSHYAIESIENIGKGKELRINRITKPLSTLRRGFRFSERFVMKFPYKSQVELMQMAMEEYNARELSRVAK